MPVSTKNPDQIYSYVDDSGKTIYSNIKKDANIEIPPAKNYSLPPQQVQQQDKPTAQIIQPSVIEPVKVIPGSNMNGSLGFMVFMAMVIIGFKLFFENIGKKSREKRRGERIRELRPEQKSENLNTILRNHYHSKIVKPPAETPQSSRSIDIVLSEETLSEMPIYTPEKTSWTLDFIRSLEWREFEKLCAKVLETKGFQAKLGDFGPDGDGGLDIRIYKQQELERPYGIAQCKAHKKEINVDTIRAFRGVMAAEKITKGFFYTSGEFTNKAWAFGKEQKIEIVAGDDLLDEIRNLSQEKQEAMLQEIVTTDYMTPTCTVCGVKMVKKSSSKSEYQFWSCPKYPRCRGKLELRWTDKEE